MILVVTRTSTCCCMKASMMRSSSDSFSFPWATATRARGTSRRTVSATSKIVSTRSWTK